jgi:phage gp36-like protein
MASTPYLSLAEFKQRVEFMRPEDVDGLETQRAGVTIEVLTDWSEYIDSRLDKRYGTPFTGTIPRVVLRWLVDLSTPSLMNMRGYNADDSAMVRMQARFDQAQADIKEAASSKDSLFGLPATDGSDGSGIAHGGPLSYSEASPYVSADRQEREGRREDLCGSGTYGGQ